MRHQQVLYAPVIVRLPAQIDITSAERAYDRLYAAFASGASVVIADFTATMFCDCSSLRRLAAIQNRAAARDAQLRLAIPPGGPVTAWRSSWTWTTSCRFSPAPKKQPPQGQSRG
jgi:hypothetical protein